MAYNGGAGPSAQREGTLRQPGGEEIDHGAARSRVEMLPNRYVAYR